MGVILGTAAYMSPEQARGKTVDKRADIWAFGCVLYEMLTGRRAFLGEDTTEILASVVKTEPDWQALPADTPGSDATTAASVPTRRTAKQRLHDISDARIEIQDARAEAASEARPFRFRLSLAAGASGWRGRWPLSRLVWPRLPRQHLRSCTGADRPRSRDLSHSSSRHRRT